LRLTVHPLAEPQSSCDSPSAMPNAVQRCFTRWPRLARGQRESVIRRRWSTR
jgi:hypothetical protein